jgi:GT2 family glycosyltransferase
LLHWRDVSVRANTGLPGSFDHALLDKSYRRWLQAREHAPIRPRARTDSIPPRTRSRIAVVALIDDASQFHDVIRSVATQSFDRWELWMVCLTAEAHDYASTHLTWAADLPVYLVQLAQLTRADQSWVPPGDGDYVVLLDTVSMLAPHALVRVDALINGTNADWIYTDDDRIDATGQRCDPYLKGAFSPELAAVDDFATRLAVVRRRCIERVGGLRSEYANAQIYELLLRVAIGGGAIQHFADVCCHRRNPVPAVLTEHHRLATERVLFAHDVRAMVSVEHAGPVSTLHVQRIAWKDTASAHLDVTVVIPTRDRIDLLCRCVESLRRTVDPRRVRLLIIDDQSRLDSSGEYLRNLIGEGALSCRVIQPPPGGRAFNYSRLMNFGARFVETPLMLQLNNDIEAIATGWLDQMTGWLARPEIGVVGAKLLYPDGSIQHAGVHVEPSHGMPGHLFCRLTTGEAGYQWQPHRTRNVSAVTGACLLTRTQLFQELHGFDEEHLAVQFNDVDYCLKVIGSGKRIVYEPNAVLYHLTGASRGRAYNYQENLFFLSKHRDYRDPFVSPHLNRTSLCGPTPLLAGYFAPAHPGGAR